MIIYNSWDILKIKFFFSAHGYFKVRPALVISSSSYQIANYHYVLCLITSIQEEEWMGDWEIRDYEAAGLPRRSMVRMKFFTVDERLVHGKTGALSIYDQGNCEKNIRKSLSFLSDDRFEESWSFNEKPSPPLLNE